MSYGVKFDNLRHNLDVLGYREHLPIDAIPLVNVIFQDLIKTTESLRDSKLQIDKLLEEKSCWELGVEPYKCDNSRLLAECNQLHIELIKIREEYEEGICEYIQKIRNLELDKRHLEEHCFELESQIRSLSGGDSKNLKNKKDGVNMSKKPFISTVRSGIIIPPNSKSQLPSKCNKCHATINWSKFSVINAHDIEKLQNDVKDQTDLIELYKKKVGERDREISRLNKLLAGGRPLTAIATDCCYKDVGTLSEDIEMLQREKVENVRKIHEYKGSMHEAMQKAVDLVEKNRKLQDELEEFKKTALNVEQQANNEISEKSRQIDELKSIVQKLEKEIQYLEGNSSTTASESDYRQSNKPFEDKRKLHQKLNELTVREQELRAENDRLNQKYQKIKMKLATIQKEIDDKTSYKADKSILTMIDEEKIRLKSERDFFQTEYLRLLEKGVPGKDIDFLKSQITAKDEELKTLRQELAQMQRLNSARSSHQDFVTTSTTNNGLSNCVQASIIRVERERDIIKAELERVKQEREALRDKLQSQAQEKMNEQSQYENEIQQLKSKIMKLEKMNRELTTSQIPQQTHITLMKNEIDELKKRVFDLTSENSRLSTSYNQLKILHEQTEKSLVEYQNKLLIAETQLENAESRLNTIGTNRDLTRNEISALKSEIAMLKTTNASLENEKDKIISEVDKKTEKIYRLESDLKNIQKKKQEMENTIRELQDKFEKTLSDKRKHESELHETSHESKSLRQQISALKASRDEATQENLKLSSELASIKADLCLNRRKLKDSEKEVERLKQQLQQYVQKVQRAEDLLYQKEQEREEMLEHYRSLSHDAVTLEGNNQSLEVKAAEQKQLLSEAETEIDRLRKEIARKDKIIKKLEDQVASLSSQISCLEKELEQAYDDQRILKVDLDATKELCDKLDLQKDKLNAELSELQHIRSNLEEQLRTDSLSLKVTKIDEVAGTETMGAESLQKLLSSSRHELEIQRTTTNQMAREINQLKRQVENLQLELNKKNDDARKCEALAKEYCVQVQELQHTLTDERFEHARNRDDVSPRYYPTI